MEMAEIQPCSKCGSAKLDIIVPPKNSCKYLAECLGDVINTALQKVSIVGMGNEVIELPDKYVMILTITPVMRTRKWQSDCKIALSGSLRVKRISVCGKKRRPAGNPRLQDSNL